MLRKSIQTRSSDGQARRVRAQRCVLRESRSLRERGAALIEAAIVMPLLLLLVAGIIEFGVGFHESGAVAAAARAGARSASALPKNATFAQAAADAASLQLQGVPSNAPQAVWVFRTAPGSSTPIGSFGACSDCQGFAWNPTQKRFDTNATLSGSQPWDPTKQNACAGQSDGIGVAVLLNHKYFFGVFGGTKSLERTSVMRLEPFIGTTPCGAG